MAIIHWKSAINGLFRTASDWNPAGVPDGNDSAYLDAPGSTPYTVTSSKKNTVKTLVTASNATLAVTGGTFTITNGTGTGSNAGTIRVSDAANLAIGGAFTNDGAVKLNSTGHKTDLLIKSDTTLNGTGTIALSAGGHNFIISNGSAHTLTNASNTIAGAGKIGDADLTLVNEADGIINGNSKKAALTLNTGNLEIINSGGIGGTTAKGLVVVSDVANSGYVEAVGTNARLRIDGTITNGTTPMGFEGAVQTLGFGAHIDLASATINHGNVTIGFDTAIKTVAHSGLSIISGVNFTNSGTLQANTDSILRVTESFITGSTGALESNGNGSLLSLDETVGAVSSTINGGEIEFKAASAANVTFTQGSVGTLKIDASNFSGTVSGFAGEVPVTFTNFFAFGDSTIDSGALQYLSPQFPNRLADLSARLLNAYNYGGMDSPVGVGEMNSQLLAADFGLTADTAYTTGGVIGGGGTNYAIAGALDASDPGQASTGDPGNQSIGNINDAGFTANPQLLSTVDQINSYLSGGKADANALYFISSGGNDVSFALNDIKNSDPLIQTSEQEAYLDAQAQTLANKIENLYRQGAQHILVNNSQSDNPLATYYSKDLFDDLDKSEIPYIKSDVHALVQDVEQDPTAYGFADSAAVQPGKLVDDGTMTGTYTDSGTGALIQPDTTNSKISGWGLWGTPQTSFESDGTPAIDQYAYLRSSDAEQINFFADDQHLSAKGQQIEANFDQSLLTDDAIDLTNIPYLFGTTNASYSGTDAEGMLTVTDGTHTANIHMLGNYFASTFVTASDGGTGTLVLDQTAAAQLALTQLIVPPLGVPF